jgi:hypothetical protein
VEVSSDSSGESGPKYKHDDIERLSLTQTPNPTQPPQEMRMKRVGTIMQSEGKKARTVSKLINELSKISNVVELKAKSQANSSNSIRDVLKCVCTLDGVEEGFDFHRMTARIFQNKEKREMFTVLEKSHLQLMFLAHPGHNTDFSSSNPAPIHKFTWKIGVSLLVNRSKSYYM